jgi:hypothetical protein
MPFSDFERFEGKEVKKMKYEKPEVFVVESATATIQGDNKGSSEFPDSPLHQTIGAYEADE